MSRFKKNYNPEINEAADTEHLRKKRVYRKNKLEVCTNMMYFVSYPQRCSYQSYNLFNSGPNCDSSFV